MHLSISVKRFFVCKYHIVLIIKYLLETFCTMKIIIFSIIILSYCLCFNLDIQ